MAGLMDKLKGAASAAKVKVDVVVDKAGDKMPPKVKQTYEKMSDKVEKVIPVKKEDDVAAASTTGDLVGDAAAADQVQADAAAPVADEQAVVAAEGNADS
jgi:CRISPR/Cas system-associated protein Cas7 (RAMP superfamily)